MWYRRKINCNNINNHPPARCFIQIKNACKMKIITAILSNKTKEWNYKLQLNETKKKNLTKFSEYTPTTAKGTLAGLSIGPSMLNAVFTFSFFLTGLTIFIAGWYLGAIMKPIPTSSTHLATPCFKRSRTELLAWI